MAEKKKNHGIETLETYTTPLPCILPTEELLERGQQLARVSADLGEHNAHATAVKKELSTKEASLEAEGQRLANIVRSKKEPRQVEVHRMIDFDRNIVWDVRTDTGEEISGSSRAARPEERQLTLEGTAAKFNQSLKDLGATAKVTVGGETP